MKICSTCKAEKERTAFNKNKAKKDGLSNTCRECSNKTSKDHYNKNKKDYIKRARIRSNEQVRLNKINVSKIKEEGHCLHCEEEEKACLDYHHLRDKDKSISRMVHTGICWERIKREIDKCILVCANCHRKIHAGLIGPL